MRGHSKRENREILLVSILHGGVFACIAERSDNVSDGNADMNANRKSDGPVIPAKRTNKTGTPEAESVEERGSPKGNAARHIHAPDTVPGLARNRCERLRLVEMLYLDRCTQGRSRMSVIPHVRICAGGRR